MRVLVLHNDPGEDATVAVADVLAQRDAVCAALMRLDHPSECFGSTLDLESVRHRLQTLQPDLVFNLVESLGGTDRLMPLATLLLDALDVPYTGAPTRALLATSDKIAAKERLVSAGLPTPAWTASAHSTDGSLARAAGDSVSQWILKPVWEHASFSMDDDAVVTDCDQTMLERRRLAREAHYGRPFFAEQFIDGREFNVSLLAGEVLPLAEIEFSAFPEGKPRIVGHQAKWDATSFEYHQTPRTFDFPSTDAPLLRNLTQLAEHCWELFSLRGYCRVDFRVDATGRPWILEVNANPCLSLDAGFAAALAQAGIDYDDAIQRIIGAAVGEVTLSPGACVQAGNSFIPD